MILSLVSRSDQWKVTEGRADHLILRRRQIRFIACQYECGTVLDLYPASALEYFDQGFGPSRAPLSCMIAGVFYLA